MSPKRTVFMCESLIGYLNLPRVKCAGDHASGFMHHPARRSSPEYPRQQRRKCQTGQVVRQLDLLQFQNDQRHAEDQQTASGVERINEIVRFEEWLEDLREQQG